MVLAIGLLALGQVHNFPIDISGPNASDDTYVRGGSTFGAQNLHSNSFGWWDGPFYPPTAATSGVLLRFDFSAVSAIYHPNQVAAASLTYSITNLGNTASMRELLVPWSATTVTYDSLPWANSSWSGTEAAALPGRTGEHTVSVTESVIRWLINPSTNFGWIVLPYGGNDGGQMQLSRSTTPPRLRVEFISAPWSPPLPPPPRLPAPPAPPPSNVKSFNDDHPEGSTGGSTGGCQSTMIRQYLPDDNFGTTAGLWWDGNSRTGYQDAVLVQFTDLFGSDPVQVRMHDSIIAATLRYNIDLSSSMYAMGDDASLHEVSVPWDASSATWTSFVGEHGLNDGDDDETGEYSTVLVATAGAHPDGWHQLDVLTSIQRWQARPELNHGWIFLPTGGGDGSQLQGCVAPHDKRLRLDIVYAIAAPAPPSPPSPPPSPPSSPPQPPPPPGLPRDTITLIGPQVCDIISVSMAHPDRSYAHDAVAFFDGNSATDRDYVLMQFHLHQNPHVLAGVSVVSATLRWHAANHGNVGELHELKVPWQVSSATYNSLPMPSHWPFSSAEQNAVYGPKVNDIIGAAGWQEADVTDSVHRWMSSPALNHGWIFVPLFSDGVGISTNNAGNTSALWPRLLLNTVRTPSPPPPMPPAPPPDLTIAPAAIVAGRDATVTISGAAAIEGAAYAFLPVGDSTCTGAARSSLYPSGGVLQGGELTVRLDTSSPYKLCIAPPSGAAYEKWDAHFAFVVSAELLVTAAPPGPSHGGTAGAVQGAGNGDHTLLLGEGIGAASTIAAVLLVLVLVKFVGRQGRAKVGGSGGGSRPASTSRAACLADDSAFSSAANAPLSYAPPPNGALPGAEFHNRL